MHASSLWRIGVVLGIVLALGLAGPSLADDKKDDKPKDKPAPEKKANVIEVDLNQLPPDVAKRLQEALAAQKKQADDDKKKEPAKTISLTEAIAIAEKTGQGKAVKAELKGHDAEAHYSVDVLDKEGKRQKVEISLAGKVMTESKEEPKGPPAGVPPGRVKKAAPGKPDDK